MHQCRSRPTAAVQTETTQHWHKGLILFQRLTTSLEACSPETMFRVKAKMPSCYWRGQCPMLKADCNMVRQLNYALAKNSTTIIGSWLGLVMTHTITDTGLWLRLVMTHTIIDTGLWLRLVMTHYHWHRVMTQTGDDTHYHWHRVMTQTGDDTHYHWHRVMTQTGDDTHYHWHRVMTQTGDDTHYHWHRVMTQTGDDTPGHNLSGIASHFAMHFSLACDAFPLMCCNKCDV